MSVQIWYSMEGLDVYEQVHQSELNRIIHLAFLPFLFYGVFRSVPHPIVPYILVAWSGYYGWVINPTEGLITYSVVSPWAILALLKKPNYKQGLGLIITSLVLQEVIGHSLFEEVNSRISITYILNAVMYSPLFYSVYIQQYFPLFIVQIFTIFMLKQIKE